MLPFLRSRNGFGPFALVLALLLSASSPVRADHSARDFPAEYLPPDHPAWTEILTLWNLGAFDDLPVFTRPLPRVDVAASLLESLAARPDLARTAPARRLLREFAFERRWLRPGEVAPETDALLDLEEDGVRLRIRSEIRATWRVDEDRGELTPGSIGALTARLYLPGRAFARAEAGVERILNDGPLGDAIVKNSEAYLSTLDTYLSLRTDAIDLAVGLGRHRWGAGESGTLLLSDAATPYPQIFFGRTFLSRFRFVATTAALHQPERRYFSAHRLEVRLGRRVTLGFQEAAAYASSSPDLLYTIGIVPYTLVQRILDRSTSPDGDHSEHRNNVLVGGDVVVRLGGGLRVDGELLIDDFATESASQPDRIGYLLGATWAGLAGGRVTEARAEFGKVYRYTYSVFYDANFVHDGVPLGYGLGPDVERIEARIDHDVTDDLRLGAGLEWTRRGASPVGEFWDPDDGQDRSAGATLTPIVEERIFPHARVRTQWRDVLWLFAKLGVLRLESEAHVEGADRTGVFGEVQATARW